MGLAKREARLADRFQRQLRSQRSRGAFIVAARKVFTEHGWRAASIDRIAPAANVGTAYSRFGSKKELLLDDLFVSAEDFLADPDRALVPVIPRAAKRRREGTGVLRSWFGASLAQEDIKQTLLQIRSKSIEWMRATLNAVVGQAGMRPGLGPLATATAVFVLVEPMNQPTVGACRDSAHCARNLRDNPL